MPPGVQDRRYMFKGKDGAGNYSRHLVSTQGITELTTSNVGIVLQFSFVSFI